MKRANTVLLGMIAFLVLPGTLLAAGDGLTRGGSGAVVPLVAESISLPDGSWFHTLPGNPHAEAIAWKPNPSLEVVEKRTEKGKIFRHPEDPLRYTAMIGSAPLHYQAADGTWVDIDTSLKAKPGGVLAATANRFQTFVQDRLGAGPLVEIRNEGHWVRQGAELGLSIEADGALRPLAQRRDGARARVMGELAIYDAGLGGSLVVRSGRLQVEQHLLLPSAPTELTLTPQGSLVFREVVTFSDGLLPQLDGVTVPDGTTRRGNTLELVEQASSTILFRFIEPIAYETDALAAIHGHTVVGEFRVTRTGASMVVEKVFAGEWFLAPDRQYPVTLDPTNQPTVRTNDDWFHTGCVLRQAGAIGGEYSKVFTYGAAHNNEYTGNTLRVATFGATWQMKDWMRFDVSGLARYITTVNEVILQIWMSAVPDLWEGTFWFNDVNLDVCAYDSTAYGQTIYNAIDTGSNFLTTIMGRGDCRLGGSGNTCMAPHWHYVDICGTAPTIIKNNRAANLGYFNIGIELDSEANNQDARFDDRFSANYPRLVINFSVECNAASDCNDNNPCTQNICNSGKCEYPWEPTQCWVPDQFGVLGCYNQNYVNPVNQCQKCNPAVSHTAWTNDDNLSCSDGQACTWQDRCSSGTCIATPYTCNDNKTCTTDTCNGAGGCTFTINSGWCLINGTCYSQGTDNPSNPCQECRADWGAGYQTVWGYNNSNTCTDNDQCTYNDHCSSGSCVSTAYSCNDGKSCTQDICNGDSSCTHNILANTCYIGGACYNDEQTSPFNVCQKCDDEVSNTAWTNWPSGRACTDDGYACTTDICDGAGTCLHNINNGTCLISGTCYNDGDDKPGDACHECNSGLTKTAWSNVPNNTVSRPCYAGFCTGGGHMIGECRNGIQWCVNGAWNNCAGMVCPTTDVCDYRDNDCDGHTDEDYPQVRNGLQTPCDGGDYDLCIQGGYYTCRENFTGVECINDGAIAFFMFEEGTGNAVNTSSGIVTTQFKTPVRVGTISGANWTSSGHPDGNGTPTKALIFDGVDDYVDIPHHTTMILTTAMTMEAWIYPTAGAGKDWRVVGGLYNGGSGGYYMGVNFTQGPGFSAWFGAACGWKYSNQIPLLNSWTHVAATYDGATVKLFLDGAKVHESACSGNGGSLMASTSPLHIGGLGAYNPTQAPFAGAIDDFGLYGVALTESEVKSRARSGDHCDGVDNDCNGLIDNVLYPDPLERRAVPLLKGLWSRKGAACDGTDNDWCLRGTYTCTSSGLAIECVNENPSEIPEICDGLDNDCNGVLPAGESDTDNDGYMICEGDCDDNSAAFHPAAPEICNGFDNNCDGVLPLDTVNGRPRGERDLDGDNHLACIPGQVWNVSSNPLQWADCNDNDPNIHKSAPEICNLIDDDCDGLTDAADPNYLAPRIESYSPIGVGAGDDRPSEPDFGPQTYTITFHGKSFYPEWGQTLDLGYGITVNSVNVVSTTLMYANITVKVQDGTDDALLIGSRDIRFTQAGCPLVLPAGFDVFGKDEVPTLTEWGIIALSALLLGFGVIAIRRRRLGNIVA
jgi:hypothetical protein